MRSAARPKSTAMMAILVALWLMVKSA